MGTGASYENSPGWFLYINIAETILLGYIYWTSSIYIYNTKGDAREFGNVRENKNLEIRKKVDENKKIKVII